MLSGDQLGARMLDDYIEHLASQGHPERWPAWARQRVMWATGKDPLKMWREGAAT